MTEVKSLNFIAFSIILLCAVAFAAEAIRIVGSSANDIEFVNNISTSQNDTFLGTLGQTKTVTAGDKGLSTFDVQTSNQTWLNFDGVNDYVNTTLNLSFPNNQITIIAFIKPLTNAAYKRIIGVEGVTMLWYNNTANGGIRFSVNNNSKSYTIDATGMPNLGNDGTTFRMIGGTYDGVYNKVYADGVRRNTGTASAVNSINISSMPLRIGTSSGSSFFNGSIDNVFIYNYSLDDRQMARVYNETIKQSKSVPILSYHQVEDDITQTTIVTVENFTAQMAYLNSQGFKTITFKNLTDWQNGNTLLSDKSVIIVFDDGYLNVFTNATPIMDSYGFVGVIGVINDTVGDSNSMNWTQLRNLTLKGWELASHSINSTSILEYSPTFLQEVYTNTKANIIVQTGYTPITFVAPGNSHNATTDTLCSNYYDVCGQTASSINTAEYFYKDTNLIGGMVRIVVSNQTTIEQFRNTVDIYSNRLLQYKYNENTGTTAYDSSGNGNNGTISGASWATDGINLTLAENTDYSIVDSSGLFTLNNSDYNWQQLRFDYTYVNMSTGSKRDATVLRLVAVVVAAGLIFICYKYINGELGDLKLWA